MAAQGTKMSILHLEDSEDDAKLIARMLAEGGVRARIERVETRARFLSALDESPDLVLADFSLPGFDGREALALLREHDPDLPFIFVSGIFGEETAVECLKAGATDFVLKDRPARLPAAVGRALDEVAQKRERRRLEREHEGLLERERAARLAAEGADRAKDAFLARVSHELRTPLTTFSGWLELLRRGDMEDVERARAWEAVQKSVGKLTGLINDIIDVASLAGGSLRLETRRVRLAPLVRDVLDALRPIADGHRQALSARVDADPEVEADVERLQQVLAKLVLNGLKFSSPGQAVAVTLSVDGQEARIGVSDAGQGFSPDYLPQLFEQFRQEEDPLTRSHGGLGLGLALAQAIVRLHGGTVAAVSPGPGQGSTFTVRLPLKPGPAPAPGPGAP